MQLSETSVISNDYGLSFGDEHFGADASHSRQMLLSSFGGHGTRCPEKEGAKCPYAELRESI